jgi:hypothetical protein
MSTYPGGDAAPKSKRTLIWLAIACFVVGLGLTGFFVFRIVATAPTTPQPIETGAVHLKDEGLTIYSSVPVPRPPCEAKDSSGGDVPLEVPKGSEQISINSETWYVVARSVDAVPPGDYSISCRDEETAASYFAGPRMSVVDFVLAIFGAIGSLLLFGILGGVLLTVGIVKNRRRHRPADTFPGAPGNYSPPGHTFPTPPPNNNFPPYNPGPNPERPSADLPPYNPGSNPDRPQDR